MGVSDLSSLRRAVFLDRDGTLNRAYLREGVSHPPCTEDELEILQGVPEALNQLHRAGFALIVVTNQPDVARGTQSLEMAQRINDALRAQIEVDALFACFHDDGDVCTCRKPHPGLILRAARELGIKLSASFLIGDRWRDTEAGHRAGCTTIQLGSPDQASGHMIFPDFWAPDFGTAAQIVLRDFRTSD